MHWRQAAGLLGGMAYALSACWAMRSHPGAPWTLFFPLVPLYLGGVTLAAGRWGWRGGTLCALTGLGVTGWMVRSAMVTPDRLFLFEHVTVNLLLGLWFGASLRPGSKPLIGTFAQRLHAMTPATWTYCRQVTKVWTVYFAAMSLLSVTVYAWLPFGAWLLLANVLTPVSVGVLFIGEYLLRYRIHPEFERVRLADVLRVVSPQQSTHRSRSR
ncbi:MAG: hypothetical protein LBQ32_13030 [Burkholderiaceae bacterium]|nr:hypothetical protein [Burkholderiaceae bacterium]